METIRLTTKDDLDKLIKECVDKKWSIIAEPTLLRLGFVNKDKMVWICRSVRIGSLRNLSQEIIRKIEERLQSNDDVCYVCKEEFE